MGQSKYNSGPFNWRQSEKLWGYFWSVLDLALLEKPKVFVEGRDVSPNIVLKTYHMGNRRPTYVYYLNRYKPCPFDQSNYWEQVQAMFGDSVLLWFVPLEFERLGLLLHEPESFSYGDPHNSLFCTHYDSDYFLCYHAGLQRFGVEFSGMAERIYDGEKPHQYTSNHAFIKWAYDSACETIWGQTSSSLELAQRRFFRLMVNHLLDGQMPIEKSPQWWRLVRWTNMLTGRHTDKDPAWENVNLTHLPSDEDVNSFARFLRGRSALDLPTSKPKWYRDLWDEFLIPPPFRDQ